MLIVTGNFSVTVVDDAYHYEITAGGSDTASESVDGGGVRVVAQKLMHLLEIGKNKCCQMSMDTQKLLAFHEQRLYFAGVTNLPEVIAASKISRLF